MIEIFIIPIILFGLVALGLRMWESGSPQTVAQTGKWSNVFLGLLAILVIAFLLLQVVFSGIGPPWWLEHRWQKEKVLKIVRRSAGGWGALRQDSAILAERNSEAGIFWAYGHKIGETTNYTLPPAIAALNPTQVRFIPHRLSSKLNEGPDVVVVEIKIFGMHSTGGHSTPYYGLEIVWGPGTNTYQPQSGDGALGKNNATYRKVADNVYEVY